MGWETLGMGSSDTYAIHVLRKQGMDSYVYLIPGFIIKETLS